MTAKLWEQVKLKLATSTGGEEERALVHPNAPGLAITMHQFGDFDVTHTGSGTKVAGPFARYTRAQLVLAELSRCLDWTQDAAGIKAQLEARAEQSVPFPGHTVTAGGATRPQTIGEFVRMVRDLWAGDEFPWESPEDDPGERAFALLNASEGPASAVPAGAGPRRPDAP